MLIRSRIDSSRPSGQLASGSSPCLGILVLALLYTPASLAQLITGVDEQARLPFWEWRTASISVRLVQRLPDQSRAYFAGRGFSKPDVEFIAHNCIFQTIFKNVSPSPKNQIIEYDLTQWQVHFHDQEYQLITREDWQQIWQQRDTGQAQKIAFQWSLLPTRQQYKASDYNWGMTVYPVPHGGSFDLTLRWKENGVPQQANLPKVECAKDIYIPPTTE
jgi:hypothetical protein